MKLVLQSKLPRYEYGCMDRIIASVAGNHPFIVRTLACFKAKTPDDFACVNVMKLAKGVTLNHFADGAQHIYLT